MVQVQRMAAVIVAALALVTVSASATPSVGAAPNGPRAGSYGTATVNITREDTLSVDRLEPFAMPGQTLVVGDFVGPTNSDEDQLDDILWYTPGAGGDVLWMTVGDRTWTPSSISINGTYTPIVGNFADGDSKEDIFWYAPGSTADWLWDFNADGTITQTSFAVNGTFEPVLGYFTDDGAQDILWYAPGSAADSWWDFNVNGTVTRRALGISGTFDPVVGSFSGSNASDRVQDVLWYAPGSAPDAVWDWNNDTTITKRPLTINGTYTPVVGNFSNDGFADVLWYAPGTRADSLWDFDNASLSRTTKALTINGTYTPLVHPWAASFAGLGGQSDIVWFGAGARPDAIWDFGATTGSYTSRPVTLDGDRRPELARLEVIEWASPGGTAYSTGSDIIDLSS